MAFKMFLSSTADPSRRSRVRCGACIFKRQPYAEAKVVSCAKGAILDVIVDLRPGSKTFRHWQAFELSAANRHQLYVPVGFAHGFQTLEDDTEVNYLISNFYQPNASTGVRYDDPVLGIDWPLPITVISDRDRNWPPYR